MSTAAAHLAMLTRRFLVSAGMQPLRAARPARCQCAAIQRRCAPGAIRSSYCRAASSTASAQRVDSVPPPGRCSTALLLIDFQQGFITGEWADEQGGAEEVLPIATAAERLAVLFDRCNFSRFPHISPILPTFLSYFCPFSLTCLSHFLTFLSCLHSDTLAAVPAVSAQAIRRSLWFLHLF